MSRGIAEVETASAARPAHAALDGHASRLQVGLPFIERLFRDGKGQVRGTVPVVRRDPAPGRLQSGSRRPALEEQQEVVAGITDVLMNAYAIESAVLRAKKSNKPQALDMARVFVCEAMDWIESGARAVLAACSEGDGLRTNLLVLRRFAKYEPVNLIGVRRAIAGRLIEAGRYV